MRFHRVRADIASWRIIDDEAVVIHTETSEYFGLNQSGTWLWARLAEHAHSTEELVRMLGARYGLAHDAVTPEVAIFVERLTALQLVREERGADGNGSLDGSHAGEEPPLDPYEPPEITRFGDLETLILSGE